MLCLRTAQVGNVVKKQTRHGIRRKLLQLAARTVQENGSELRNFALNMNGHGEFLLLFLFILSQQEEIIKNYSNFFASNPV